MSLTRDVTTVGSATLMSRALALLRDIGVAALLGAGPLADAYFAALQLPNLFRKLVAEGALNGALVPMWLRLRNGDGARIFAEQVFGVMLVMLGGLALICAVFAPAIIHLVAPGFTEDGERFVYAVTFLRWSIGYVALAGLASVAVAILNAEGRVAASAGSVAIFNYILVGAVLLVMLLGSGESKLSGIVLTASFAIGGIAQLGLLTVALMRLANAPRRLRFTLSNDVSRFLPAQYPQSFPAGCRR